MADVFVIGLPKAMQRRIEARARRAASNVSAIWAGLGKQGTPILLPHPQEAIYTLHAYLQHDFEKRILVLPYAPVPAEVIQEVEVVSSLNMGATTIIREGDPKWPTLERNKNFDEPFLNALFVAVGTELFGPENQLPVAQLPAAHLQGLVARCPRFVILDGAVDRCDEVSAHRQDFIRCAGDALLHLCEQNGNVGTLFTYFESRGLDYARTGGVTTTLEVFRAGQRVVQQESNDHIKQGDNTTPQAAARVYYQTFELQGLYYVAILYAGPHPDRNISATHTIAT